MCETEWLQNGRRMRGTEDRRETCASSARPRIALHCAEGGEKDAATRTRQSDITRRTTSPSRRAAPQPATYTTGLLTLSQQTAPAATSWQETAASYSDAGSRTGSPSKLGSESPTGDGSIQGGDSRRVTRPSQCQCRASPIPSRPSTSAGTAWTR